MCWRILAGNESPGKIAALFVIRRDHHFSGGVMPYVNIRITKEGATAEQKARLIEGATQLLVDVLGKNPKTTVVVIDEVDTDNWGIAGETVTVRRARGE
jgi:4-oxalocrotonate tautomerase